MKKLSLLIRFCAAVMALTSSGFLPSILHAQAVPPAAAPAESVAERSKELSTLLNDIWQDKLKHSPEYATYLDDKRYDDQLSDLSPRAVNEALERGRKFIEQLAMIDTTGLTHQEQLSAELMLRSLVEDQEAAPFKEWEMPVTQYAGVQLDLPQLAEHTSFDTVDDYDHYIARLGKMPLYFTQTMTNMQTGMAEGRTPPQYLMEKALAQTQAIAAQKPAETPFALPLKKFPENRECSGTEAHLRRCA